MSNIPTAEEWLSNHKELSMYDVEEYDEGGYIGVNENALYKIMIEFAKFHVKEALKSADENSQVCIVDYEYELDLPTPIYGVDSMSILDAYSLANIK